jgi:iron complex transport system substrate-binding protein
VKIYQLFEMNRRIKALIAVITVVFIFLVSVLIIPLYSGYIIELRKFTEPCENTVLNRGTSGFPLHYADASGKKIVLSKTPERIVSLNRQTSEAMKLLSAGDLMAGTGDNTVSLNSYLGYGSMPDVGSDELLNVEAIVSLKPDIVFAPTRRLLFLDSKLSGAGIKIIRIDNFYPETEDYELELLGRVLGREKESKAFLDWKNGIRTLYREKIEAIPDTRRKSVAALSLGFLLSNGGFRAFPSVSADGRKGSGEGYSTILAGGKDAFDELSLNPGSEGTAVGVSGEYLIVKNPEFVTVHGSFVGGYDIAGTDALEKAFRTIRANASLSKTSAGINDNIVFFHTDLLGASKREPGILHLASILYPELFRDVSPENFLKEYFETWLHVPFKGIWVYGGSG